MTNDFITSMIFFLTVINTSVAPDTDNYVIAISDKLGDRHSEPIK